MGNGGRVKVGKSRRVLGDEKECYEWKKAEGLRMGKGHMILGGVKG